MITHMVTNFTVLQYSNKVSITFICPGIAQFIHMIHGNIACHAMEISKSEVLHVMDILQLLKDNFHSLWGGRYYMD